MSKLKDILRTRRAPVYMAVLPSFYSNTLTGLIPDLYAGLDVVSRELVGFIPMVNRSTSAERAAVNEAVKFHVAPAVAGVDIAPAMTVPEPSDVTVGNGSITITKARAFPFGFAGEEQRGLNNGPGYLSVQADLFAQALRGMVNEIESDLALTAYKGASRAFGTAGTTPFASDTSMAAELKKILDDNGAPMTDRGCCINTTAGAKLRTLMGINANRVAQDQMNMQQGSLIDLHGFVINESAQIKTHTKGTGANISTDAAGYAVGSTLINLDASTPSGTGTIVAGDVITFAGDANKYVVVTGDADASNGGSIVIAAPGLLQAIPTAETAITVGNSYTANVAHARSAIGLAVRPPALPQEGDLARDRMLITDPRSGMVFEVAIYPGYRKVRFEVAAAWGTKAIKPEHIAIALG